MNDRPPGIGITTDQQDTLDLSSGTRIELIAVAYITGRRQPQLAPASVIDALVEYQDKEMPSGNRRDAFIYY